MAFILSSVASIAGTTEELLRQTRRGRGGNPALRLAVLALSRWTDETQREIGKRLGITSAQAALVLHRHRKNPKEPVKSWLEDLENMLSENA